MQKAEYPEKSCREGMMSTSGAGHNCELPVLHAGPHATFSLADTVTARDAWEVEHPDWREHPDLGGDIIV
jgi:hypothetical protein